MVTLNIPGREELVLHHLVLDFNGTIAHDGMLVEGLKERLEALSKKLSVHVITADTNGTAREQCRDLPVSIYIIGKTDQELGKRAFVTELGAEGVVCAGNGSNDKEMFSVAALAIAVTGREGCAIPTLLQSNIAVNSILDGLDLLIHKHRLIATLRK
ncbi:HAD family hydrolase [Bacillus marinisedimentorum]|uniref:HAD family hydrolase n=1 Tax=Bacillus marinisedimentorum TaxID=1821260 RepID=UPI000871C33D|nr:HAD family hydrolase [Bacillus marinisedimentorum]